MMRKILILIAFSLVIGATLSQAQSADTDQIEAEAKSIEALLIAPCCWRQPILDHQSEVADQMKGEIRAMLAEGKSRQEILDNYVSQYGARILAVPPQEGFNRLSFLMPVFFVLAGLVVVGACLRRWQRHPSTVLSQETGSESAPTPPGVDAEMSRRIQEELDAIE